MKRWMQIVLILSLAFNFGFLGAFIYRMLEHRTITPFSKSVSPRQDPSMHKSSEFQLKSDTPFLNSKQRRELHKIRQKFQPGIHQVRQDLIREKGILAELLIENQSDSIQIANQLGTVHELQKKMDKEVIFELIREARILKPRERELFIRMALRRLERDKQHSTSAQMGSMRDKHRQSISEQ